MSVAGQVADTLHTGAVTRKSDGTAGAKSDTLDLLHPAVGLLIHGGATGTIRVLYLDGTESTFADGDLAKGTLHLFKIKRIFSTGTSLGNGDFRLATCRG